MQVVFASTISNFTFILPISAFGSLGTFEAGWTIGFILLGLSKDMALPIGLFTNLFGILVNGCLAIIGYIYLMSKNKKNNKIFPSA